MEEGKRFRLLEVHVTPIFVVDDGETLEKAVDKTHVVPAKDWPNFMDQFNAGVALTQASLDAATKE